MARSRLSIVALACVLLAATRVQARRSPCADDADQARIDAALARIRRSVDPCGESADVGRVLARLERCAVAICTSASADRNLFDRATITWNPGLRTRLESTADDRSAAPIDRDPTASLLHELVHAADACDGHNPGEHELDAVRIENIYRRAAGLRQRTRYGERPLPPSMTRACRPGRCTCARRDGIAPPRAATPEPSDGPQAADSTQMPADIDVEPAR